MFSASSACIVVSLFAAAAAAVAAAFVVESADAASAVFASAAVPVFVTASVTNDTVEVLVAGMLINNFTCASDSDAICDTILYASDACAALPNFFNVVDAFFASSPENVICCEIDVDESFDLYSYFKSKKMVNGIPVILCYKKGNLSYIPDDSITGSDPAGLDAFFKRCGLHLLSLKKMNK